MLQMIITKSLLVKIATDLLSVKFDHLVRNKILHLLLIILNLN